MVFRSFEDFFSFLFSRMKEDAILVVVDEFQNFEFVDTSVFSTIQNQWDREKDRICGAFILIGSVFTLMRRIFEGKKEPLFGRATAKLYVEPLGPTTVAKMLSDHHSTGAWSLVFHFTVFGGLPKYYFLLDRYRLFGKDPADIIGKLYCESNAPLQTEGKDLLIEEFGKNYHLYFSILQVIANGATQMARIADRAGINVNSISRYLEELTSYYQILERRVPVIDAKEQTKQGRYYIKDQALRFWFRYIFRNQSLIEIGDEKRLIEKIVLDIPTLMGWSFEELVRAILVRSNREQGVLPFRFTRLGGFWTRKGNVEIDVVAVQEEEESILFGECELRGREFTLSDAKRLKEKAQSVHWRVGKRKEFFALFSMSRIPARHRQILEREGILAFDLKQLMAPPTGRTARKK